jgi:hypothetical protein
MKLTLAFPVLIVLAATVLATAQDGPQPASRADFRYSVTVIDDVTFDTSFQPSLPASAAALKEPSVTFFQNQLLLEPSFTLRYRSRWTFASAIVGRDESFRGLSAASFDLPSGSTAAATALDAALEPYTGTHATLRVKEAYAGLSAGDFDFMLGRRIVRWGVGYAFTPVGVLDPPRTPTDPSDRLNLNHGRDLVKADWVHGPHALSLAWSTAALAPAGSNSRDTAAFRYNLLVHGFDTSIIAGNDRGGDAFGGLTFTRVFGQAWELHGEAAWRQHEAILLGAKYTARCGVSFIGEFYTPPNIPYYRDSTVSSLAGRQYYGFFYVSKSRLRELPGWKQWDLSASMVANMNDCSYTVIFDATRRFGSHFSSYLHTEIPQGGKATDYGATPYSAATSAGVRFQL